MSWCESPKVPEKDAEVYMNSTTTKVTQQRWSPIPSFFPRIGGTTMSSIADSSSSASHKPETIDPILRNALRYTISAEEYRLLHQYLISRAPPPVRKRTPPPQRYDAIVKSVDDYNVAAIRTSLRLAVLSFSGLEAWDFITSKVFAPKSST